MHTPRIAVLLAVHDRHEYLNLILSQIRELPCWVHVQVVPDRPTLDVMSFVEGMEDRANLFGGVQVIVPPFRPLEPGRPESFMEFRSWQLKELEPHGPFDYVLVWDDDQILEDPTELSSVLMARRADLVYGTRVYFWDGLAQVNTRIPCHRSTFAWRWHPGDWFPSKKDGRPGPLIAHQKSKVVLDLQSKILDYGYVLRAHRTRVWSQYKAVGKIDPTTTVLCLPPTLETWTGKTYDPSKQPPWYRGYRADYRRPG